MNIRKTFTTAQRNYTYSVECNTVLNDFEPSTEDEIHTIISEYGINCSPDDPVPAYLLKNNIEFYH